MARTNAMQTTRDASTERACDTRAQTDTHARERPCKSKTERGGGALVEDEDHQDPEEQALVEDAEEIQKGRCTPPLARYQLTSP